MPRNLQFALFAILAVVLMQFATQPAHAASPEDGANVVCNFEYQRYDNGPFLLTATDCYTMPGWGSRTVQPDCQPFYSYESYSPATIHIWYYDRTEFYNTGTCVHKPQSATAPEVRAEVRAWASRHQAGDSIVLWDATWSLELNPSGQVELAAYIFKPAGDPVKMNVRRFNPADDFAKLPGGGDVLN